MGQKRELARSHFTLPACSLFGLGGGESNGQVDRRARSSKHILPCDSPVTLSKVSALGSYYTAAAFFPGDWRGQSSSSYQNKQARLCSVLSEWWTAPLV